MKNEILFQQYYDKLLAYLLYEYLKFFVNYFKNKRYFSNLLSY